MLRALTAKISRAAEFIPFGAGAGAGERQRLIFSNVRSITDIIQSTGYFEDLT